MPFAFCSVSAAPIRKEPAHRSEMTSQLLFGEAVEILANENEWRQVRCTYDGYTGWLTEHMITEVEAADAASPARFVATGQLNQLRKGHEPVPVPLGVSLPGFQEKTGMLWNGYQFAGSYRDTGTAFRRNDFHAVLQPWLHAPYLWGGRTFMGVDCSGFVQTVFKTLGVPLLRDAWQQQEQGTAVELQQSSEGDLAFFHNEQGRIVHVGIVLEGQKVMHASGKVRVDALTSEGIRNAETGKRTHTLHSIKRILSFPN